VAYGNVAYNFSPIRGRKGVKLSPRQFRAEHRLSVFEIRVVRRTFGPKRGGAVGSWRKLHDEEVHNLYCSPDVIKNYQVREYEMGRALACMAKRNACSILVGKPEGRRLV
jgi:hypothetical protein